MSENHIEIKFGASTPGRRWEDSREALAAFDDIKASRGLSHAEIVKALYSVDVRNALAAAVYVMRSGPKVEIEEVERIR